jgi:DNA-binding NtrC family response regulator
MNKGKTILVIDDDEDLREFLKKIFNNMGHLVIQATNLFEAEILMSYYYPHMIMIDINLEQSNGFEFVSKVRKIDPYKRIQIFMMSTKLGNKSEQYVKQLDLDFLQKPITNNVLLTTMKKFAAKLDLQHTKKIPHELIQIKMRCLGELTKISETTVILESNVKFYSKINLKIENNKFLKRLNMERIQFIADKPSGDSSGGMYPTPLIMIGLKEADYVNIRKLNK